MMSMMSMAYFQIATGNMTADQCAEAGLFGTLKDGVITFPVKALLVTDDDGTYYANNNGGFKIILPSAYKETDEEATTASVSSSIKGTEAKSGKEFGKARLSVGQKISALSGKTKTKKKYLSRLIGISSNRQAMS